jgi:cell division protein FtsL
MTFLTVFFVDTWHTFPHTQTRVSSVLLNQEKQQMLLTVGLCVLATAVLLAAIALFLVRRRYQAQQKIKGLTQSIDGQATRDYQVRISYWLARGAHIISSAPSIKCDLFLRIPEEGTSDGL